MQSVSTTALKARSTPDSLNAIFVLGFPLTNGYGGVHEASGLQATVGVAVDVGVDVAVAVGVNVAVDVGVNVAVAVGVNVAVAVGVNVAVAVGVNVAVDV